MAVEKQRFQGVIEDAGGGGAFVTVPFDVEQVFGKKRVKFRGTIDGEPYRGSLVRMGGEHHIFPLLKAIRVKLGKSVGDEVEIELEEDTEPRVVTVPDDLRAALQEHSAESALFDGLSYTHQREYVLWIEEARQAATRQRRIGRTIEMLQQGKRER